MPAQYGLPKVDEDKIRFCKTWQHAFDELDHPPSGATSVHTVMVYLRCIHCTSERHDPVNVYGEIFGRRYIYPENYRDVPKGPKADLRVTYLYGRKDFIALRRRTARQANNGNGKRETA